MDHEWRHQRSDCHESDSGRQNTTLFPPISLFFLFPLLPLFLSGGCERSTSFSLSLSLSLSFSFSFCPCLSLFLRSPVLSGSLLFGFVLWAGPEERRTKGGPFVARSSVVNFPRVYHGPRPSGKSEKKGEEKNENKKTERRPASRRCWRETDQWPSSIDTKKKRAFLFGVDSILMVFARLDSVGRGGFIGLLSDRFFVCTLGNVLFLFFFFWCWMKCDPLNLWASFERFLLTSAGRLTNIRRRKIRIKRRRRRNGSIMAEAAIIITMEELDSYWREEMAINMACEHGTTSLFPLWRSSGPASFFPSTRTRWIDNWQMTNSFPQ